MIKNILLFVFFILVTSCSEEENCCSSIESHIFINIKDSNGNDLLNPISGNINHEEIKVFYKDENEDFVEVDNAQLDNSNGFELINPSDGISEYYTIKLFLNSETIIDDISNTLVEWSSGDTDEFKTEFNLFNNNKIASKIWVNDELLWDKNHETLLLSIIK